MALTLWKPYRGRNPFEEMLDMQERISRLFSETLGRFPATREEGLERTWSPAVDIYEDKDHIIVRAELPGIKRDDVSIEVKDNILTLKGERKHEDETRGDNYHRIERFYGKFSRSFTLPATIKIDKVKANYKDGILEITLPKSEEAKPKAIPIENE